MAEKLPKVFLGGDHAGVELRKALKEVLVWLGREVEDLGSHDARSVDYPDYAMAVSERVARGEGLGVLVCGTGIGVDMVANKMPGVRSARCTDAYSARMSRAHNNANVLCLGARVTGPGLAEEILKVWLETPFEGGRHQARVDKIDALDSRHR
jgi:ribose 5-phosphate isomerase B